MLYEHWHFMTIQNCEFCEIPSVGFIHINMFEFRKVSNNVICKRLNVECLEMYSILFFIIKSVPFYGYIH